MIDLQQQAFREKWNWRTFGTGNRNGVASSKTLYKTINMAANDHHKCDSWTNFNSCIKNDKQCDRIWNGNSRTCGADYGIQNNDYEYIPNNFHSYDFCYADHRPSISYLFYFRGNEEKRADIKEGDMKLEI